MFVSIAKLFSFLSKTSGSTAEPFLKGAYGYTIHDVPIQMSD